jgi:hypothetical protein
LIFRAKPREAARRIRGGTTTMTRAVLIILATALLAGCTAASSYPIRSRYQGQHIDLFFLEWGAPIASHKLHTGGRIYLWYSGRKSAYKPGHSDDELIGNTAWWRGYRLKTYSHYMECGVRIVTAPDDTIVEILVHGDSIGWWQSWRCYRIFGPPVRTMG